MGRTGIVLDDSLQYLSVKKNSIDSGALRDFSQPDVSYQALHWNGLSAVQAAARLASVDEDNENEKRHTYTVELHEEPAE